MRTNHLILIVTLSMLFVGIFTENTWAQSSAVVRTASETVEPDVIVSVPVILDLTGTVAAGTFELRYDPSILEPATCTPDEQDLFDTELCNLDFDNDDIELDAIRFSVISTAGVDVDSFTLATVEFQVIGNDGTQSPLEIVVPALSEPNGTQINVTIQDGFIKVESESQSTPVFLPLILMHFDTSEMVGISGGSFQMGCVSGNADESCPDDELPLHTVHLDSYQIDKFEVTNARYQECVDAGSCTPPATGESDTRASYYGDPIYSDYPVIHVTWEQAHEFCRWDSKFLPSEAQWEKAARGSIDTRNYPWGDSPPVCTKTNFADLYGECVGDTTPVFAYPLGASPYGAMDMTGNVWEWVNDWYSADYYEDAPEANPLGPTDGTHKVLRGGSWYRYDDDVRVSRRFSVEPETHYGTVGFRCARTLPPIGIPPRPLP